MLQQIDILTLVASNKQPRRQAKIALSPFHINAFRKFVLILLSQIFWVGCIAGATIPLDETIIRY